MIIALTITLVAVLGIFVFIYVWGNPLLIRGEWTRHIDMSSMVGEAMEDYLESANMGDEIDLSAYVGDLKVAVDLTLDGEGNFTEQINEESYVKCEEAANAALAEAVRELITIRMEAVKVSSDEDIDSLIEETVGMSLESYLEQYGPVLMPQLSELQKENDRSGSYECDRTLISLQGADGEAYGNAEGCQYMVSNETLVIDYGDAAYIYVKGGRDNE